jgi:hypothetical protein
MRSFWINKGRKSKLHTSQLSCNTSVDLQLDAQNSYLFIYNTFIKILYIFRALACSSSGGPLRNCIIHAVSGIVTLCRWLSCEPVKKEMMHRAVICIEWRYQRLHIYNYDVDLLKMSRAMLDKMYRILMTVLYTRINIYEFCASSWKSTKVILQCTVNHSSRYLVVRLENSAKKAASDTIRNDMHSIFVKTS